MNLKTNKNHVGYQLRFDRSAAILDFNGHKTRLDLKTAQLLSFFINHKDQVIERQTLIEHLWQDYQASSASLNRLISVLRKYLGINGHQFIVTIHKIGYRFVIPEDVELVECDSVVAEITMSDNEPVNTVTPTTKPLIQTLWSRRPWLALVPVAMLFIVSLGWFSLSGNSGQPLAQQNNLPRLALFPFKSVSEQGANPLFTQGVTTEVLNALISLKQLSVVDSSDAQLSNLQSEQELVQLAEKLGANFMLSGNVSLHHDNLHITVQLIEGNKGELVFTTLYQHPLENDFGVQSAAALEIIDDIQLRVNEYVNQHPERYHRALTQL